MNYLSCRHCGHHNALRSEFLTFCERCGKKLPYTFADWKQKNPEGSFEAFCGEVAIYIADAPPPKPGWMQQYLWPAGRRGLILAAVLVFALVAVAGTYFGKQAIVTWSYPKAEKSWLYSTWQTVTIGRQALQISAPVHLSVNDQALNPDLAKMVEYAKSYRNREEGGLQISVDMFSYRETVTNNLDEAAKKAARDLQQEPGVSDLELGSSPISRANAQGVLQEGTLLYKNAVKLAFYNLVMVQGPHRWLVSIRCRADDPTGQELAKRVVSSVQIK
ncbi:hypothetical protein [Chitinophaga japonensis]|uniref:Uncharacterized protein n=1 Tax=Chitinophaga japonensis TaxID=104662 RepID=A0A562T440_CHIJA|nr:hypothetical protein [Chitinophaga japonensis]TWI88133.1 hypothetical protein LX66_2208 [Chitinophaga japonensis]